MTFKTKLTPEEVFGLKPVKKQPKNQARKFFVLWLPLGCIIGLFISVMTDAAVWFPAWGISTFVLWAWDAGREDGRN